MYEKSITTTVNIYVMFFKLQQATAHIKQRCIFRSIYRQHGIVTIITHFELSMFV